MQRAVILVAAIGLLVAATQTAATQKGPRQIRSAALHASFEIDPSWHETTCGSFSPDEPCLALQTGDTESDLVYLRSKAAPLDEVMKEDVLFRRDAQGRWIRSGRMGQGLATPIQGDHWSGWQGIADCGVEDENGIHDTGECMTAFASNGKRTIILETSGTAPNDEVVKWVLSSLRIDGR